jgi:hypothetical protein
LGAARGDQSEGDGRNDKTHPGVLPRTREGIKVLRAFGLDSPDRCASHKCVDRLSRFRLRSNEEDPMRAWLGVVGWVALVPVLGGCHENIVLKAPNAGAPLSERQAAYERLRPISYHQTHVTYVSGSTPVATETHTDYLQLADGTRIYLPEDILPVVPADSPSARAATRSESARNTSGILRGLGVVSFVVGAGVGLIPIVAREPGSEFDPTPLYVGLGAIALGGILYLVGNGFATNANDEAATAYETYDGGLKQHLGLCEPGKPCRTATVVQTPRQREDVPLPPKPAPEQAPPNDPKPETPVYKPSRSPFGTQ